MKFLNQEIQPLGMGCWPIGGAMYAGEESVGYTGANDETSIRTIHAALANGISLFDTAAAYGAGHSERLLGKALKQTPEAIVITKIGIGIDPETRHLSFGTYTPDMVRPAIEDSLKRLDRDCIDMILLHLNELPVLQAEQIFTTLDRLIEQGKIRSYGWSTDYSESVSSVAARPGFDAVEFALNIFFDAPRMQKVVNDNALYGLVRSPLAMGLLSGNYSETTVLPADDIRASTQSWMEYFNNGRANLEFAETLSTVRGLLTSGGRTLVQGALSWIWGQCPTLIPVPGAKTPEQIEELAAALEKGPLPSKVMLEIEKLVHRNPNEPDRPR